MPVRVSLEQSRLSVVERLRCRGVEIEEAVELRVFGVSAPTEIEDPEYVEGLRAAVSAAIDYGLQGIERGRERPPRIPLTLLSQARIAARSSISLDRVLRRYFAGYALLGEFLVEEAEAEGLSTVEIKGLLGAKATLFDRLLAAIGEEYGREKQSSPDTVARRQTEQVRQLLTGERLDAPGLAYELRGWHLGVLASGPGASELLRGLASALDRRLLSVPREGEVVWAWLGGRRPFERESLGSAIASLAAPELTLAIGEPGEGLAGWRLTHLQAKAALPIAQRGDQQVVRYGDVTLLSAVLADEVLAVSLQQIYIEPLGRERDGGETSKRTLRAYFDCGQNVSSAAATLGVKRHTVTNRLHAVEERLGRSLDSCAAELDSALRLEELDTPSFPRRAL